MLQEAQVSADSERASEALEGLGLVALARGDYATAGPLLEQSLEATADADPGERTALYSGLVEVHAHTGDTARAMAVLENCLDRLRRSPVADPAKVVRYSLWLSRSYADAGDHTRAGAALSDALRHGDVRVDLPSRAAAAFALARVPTPPTAASTRPSATPIARSRCTTSGTTTGRCASRTWCMPRRSWTSPT